MEYVSYYFHKCNFLSIYWNLTYLLIIYLFIEENRRMYIHMGLTSDHKDWVNPCYKLPYMAL